MAFHPAALVSQWLMGALGDVLPSMKFYAGRPQSLPCVVFTMQPGTQIERSINSHGVLWWVLNFSVDYVAENASFIDLAPTAETIFTALDLKGGYVEDVGQVVSCQAIDARLGDEAEIETNRRIRYLGWNFQLTVRKD